MLVEELEYICPVLLAGGMGKRADPNNMRGGIPKQFIPLNNGSTLYDMALKRVTEARLQHAPIIVGHHDHQIALLKPLSAQYELILETARLNTAMATALAAKKAISINPKMVLIVLPCDHFIQPTALFWASVLSLCFTVRDKHAIGTIGIRPTHPHTGYGYIHADNHKVIEFIEKPKIAHAMKFVESGKYLWNSGIFVVEAQIYLDELNLHQPEIAHMADQIWDERSQPQEQITVANKGIAPPLSIDYAIMEKTNRAIMVEGLFEWRDIGTQDLLMEMEHA